MRVNLTTNFILYELRIKEKYVLYPENSRTPRVGPSVDAWRDDGKLDK